MLEVEILVFIKTVFEISLKIAKITFLHIIYSDNRKKEGGQGKCLCFCLFRVLRSFPFFGLLFLYGCNIHIIDGNHFPKVCIHGRFHVRCHKGKALLQGGLPFIDIGKRRRRR